MIGDQILKQGLPDEIDVQETHPLTADYQAKTITLSRVVAFKSGSAEVVAVWMNADEALEWLSASGYERVINARGAFGLWSRVVESEYEIKIWFKDDNLEIKFVPFTGRRSDALEYARAKFSIHSDGNGGRRMILKEDRATEIRVQRVGSPNYTPNHEEKKGGI